MLMGLQGFVMSNSGEVFMEVGCMKTCSQCHNGWKSAQ